jgi:hypothetical protein
VVVGEERARRVREEAEVLGGHDRLLDQPAVAVDAGVGTAAVILDRDGAVRVQGDRAGAAIAG